MQVLWQDVRYALRMLRRNPGFAGVVVLVLALGIGPNSAIFSMISAALLRPLPIPEPDRVVTVWETLKSKGFNQAPVSSNNFLDWKAQNTVFESMAAAMALPEFGFNIVAGGEPERVNGAKASADYLKVLGIKPFLGRGFVPEEDRPGGTPVAVVSYGFWERRLRSDPQAVGRAIPIDGEPRTIVGVLPRDFALFGNVQVWVPLAFDPARNERMAHNFGALARLKPGVTLQQAQAEMTIIAKRLERQYPDTNEGWGALVMPVSTFLNLGGIVPALLFLLLGAVGLLLLLACANIANLLLARAASREREVAIRTALGAGRGRVLRQLITESVILALAGGAAGLLLASWCIHAVRAVIPDLLSMLKQMSLDWRVVAFTFLVSVLTGVLFGIAPALKSARAEVNESLKAGGRTLIASGMRVRSALLVVEVALALVLSVGAGLLIHSFAKLTAVDPGLRTKNVLTMQLTLPWARYPDAPKKAAFYKTLIERLEALPGVRAAGAVNFLPFRSSILNSRMGVWPFLVDGQPPARTGQEPTADARIVTPGFFDAMAIPLRHGRYFDRRDTGESPRAVIINEALARKHFGGLDPVGRKLRLAPWDEPGRAIVGVVADVKLYALDWTVEPAFYIPQTQQPHDVMSLVVHTTQDPRSLAAAIQREVRTVDPEQPVADVKTMDAVVGDSLILRRIAMLLLGAFATLALVLATVGIYGLTAYTVSQRSHEIGLRMALGAQRGDVLRMVLGRGMFLALAGTAIGLAGALAVAGLMKGFLFGITGTDPAVLFGVPALLLAVSALASFVPARRAMNVEPVTALHYE